MSVNVAVLELVEDVNPSTRTPRIRVRCRELKPDTYLVDLKNLTAEQINQINAGVGHVMSLPVQVMASEGRLTRYLSVTDDEFFVLRPIDSPNFKNPVTTPSVAASSSEKTVTNK